jgi:sterol desaturase/sphingolipid hydroxylase (fatty acid hydroxylase superfamily)
VFEHKSEPLLSHRDFLGRVARSVLAGALLVAVSLLAGMAGYHALERLAWIDAFLNAAMLLGGMGPVATPQTEGGKLFAGLYALYCGLVVIVVAGIVLAPVAHRILHQFHLEERDES